MWGRIKPHAVFLILANIVLRASCKGSLTFLIDDTSSMSNDITQVKSSVNRISNVVFNEKSSLISNMVLVTFNDPDAQVRAVTDNRNTFKRTLDAVYAHNVYNPDCWEPSMKGLLLALEKSNSDSYIYVFTDAPARDYQDGRYVKELCQKKQSQIVFVLTGHCYDYYEPQAFDVYFDIAHACSGLAFDVTKSDVEQVLRTIEETIRGNKTVITSTIVPARVKKAIPFTIDDHTDYAIVSVSGRNVYLDVKGPSANLEKIMWNNNGKVVKLSNAKPGTYVATVMGQTKTSVVIVGRTDFFFTHGFSELKPKSLGDTSLQPIADAKVHLSIAVTDDHHTVKITSAQILDINENPTKSPVPLTEISKDFYVTDPFVAPSQRFKIAVNGIVKATGKPIKRIVKIPITPAAPPKILPTNTKPTVAIAEGKAIEIEYNSTVKLTCKVVAFPEPKIQWINYNGGLMPSKMSVQEFPYKYISYMDISYASKGDRYKCYAVNDVGRDDTIINVVVKDPFTFKSTPSGITKLTYGTEGTITCDVTSRLPMDIHWLYANEITGQTRAIETSDKYVVSASRTQVTIKKMDLDLVGRYTCKVSLKNKKDVFKSFNTRVIIDGLIAPKVQGGNEIKVTKGKTAIIECKVVRGVPAPKITWLFGGKSGSTFTTLAGSETVLRITNVEDKHEGKYKCIGENVAGKDEHVTTLFVQDIPKILPTSSMVYQATEGDALLRIPCVAAGVPKPVIVWKLSGHYITPSAKYSTEDGALIIRNPKVSDTNLYTCEAKNEAGAVSATFKTYIRQAPQVSGVAAKKVRIGTPASVECKLISCDKSFTIVLDTTKSMQEELDIIKVNLPTAINASYNTDITNYILVPFNDPDVGVTTVVLTPRELLTSLNAITVSGGHKCPENSLAGIEKALQVSKHKSNIFVFTDAYAKDVSKLSSIENLCRNTRSQVVIFLSGFCSSQSSPTVNEQVYYDVAKACSGAVVHFDPATLRQAFKYIKEVMNVEWTDVISYDTFTEYKELPFTVDSFTKTVLLVVSGDNPRLEVSTPDGSESTVEKVLDTRHTQVVRLTNPSIGVHKATIRCRNKTSVVLYKRYELPLRFGFSTKLPRSMSETSRRPMPGRNNKILIDATQSKIKLETIEIQVANEKEKKALVFGENSSTGMYMTETFIDPGKTFCIWVKGYDTSTNQEIKGSSEFFIPQSGPGTDSRWTKPQSEILDAEPLVDYGTNATFACKVTGYPEPTILWEDDAGVTLPSESVLIEIPALYISYVSIENVTVNSTIYCKTKNSEGEASHSLNLYVNRPYTFDVIQTPADQTIEYGSEGKLYCEVIAYPAAEAKWYHNDTEVTPFDDLQIDPENKALWIKNMTVSNVGEYKCELTNEANIKTYSALVTISGIEAPQVEVEKASMTLKLGDWSDLECRIIKGKPSPAITWTFKSENGFEFRSLPDGVVADDGKLKIASAQPEHKGVYRCDAANIEGHHSADITVQLQYPPSISKDAEPRTVTVKEEDDVVLPCEVDASPAASVRWEMSQDDVIMALDDRHRTDRRHTHRFKALWKDSGNYHCIAQNNIGTAEKIITVNVLVAPYIEAPKVKNVVARTGDNVVLSCNVLYGNPVPSSKWEFIAPDSTTKVLKRSNSSSVLHLNNVSYTNEGSYLCIADNDVGTDSVNIYVKIQ